MADITIQNLLESGVHFGHQTRRWNPKMKKYIFTERNGIYIIDLQKSLALLKKACDRIRDIAANGDYILFVGTKPQAASIIQEEVERCSQYYVINRWAGGMLTNYRTIRQSIKRLDHLEKMSTDGTYELLTKKEILNLEKQREKLSYLLDGIRNMNRLPGLLVVVDTKKEKIAVNEARRLGIPICAVIDTNCDPDPITLPIPGNDDAIRSIKILLSSITDSVLEGMQLFADKGGIEEKEKAEFEADRHDKEKKKFGRKTLGAERRPKTPERGKFAGPAKSDKGEMKKEDGKGASDKKKAAPTKKAPPESKADGKETPAKAAKANTRKTAEKAVKKAPPGEKSDSKPSKAVKAEPVTGDDKGKDTPVTTKPVKKAQKEAVSADKEEKKSVSDGKDAEKSEK